MIASNSLHSNYVEQPRLVSNTIQSHTSLGFYGEHYAAWRLFKSGYKVDFLFAGTKSGDLLATDLTTGEITKVEVKTSLRNEATGRFSFCLRKLNKTNYQHSDAVMLVAIDNLRFHHVFVVPVDAFNGVSYFAFRTNPIVYAGKLDEYRVRSSHVRLN